MCVCVCVCLEQIFTTSIDPCDQATLQVTVSNTGMVAGDEVVQVYMTFKVSTLPWHEQHTS